MKQAKRTHWTKSAFYRLASAATMTVGAVFLTGCAQVMCIREPAPFRPTCLTVGEPRLAVIGQLGAPAASEQRTTGLTDVYRYTDGGPKNSVVSKTARVVVYTGGDVFTLFLDQIIWMPTEHFGFAGTDHAVTVDFVKGADDSWQVSHVDDQKLRGPSRNKEAL